MLVPKDRSFGDVSEKESSGGGGEEGGARRDG